MSFGGLKVRCRCAVAEIWMNGRLKGAVNVQALERRVMEPGSLEAVCSRADVEVLGVRVCGSAGLEVSDHVILRRSCG